MSAVEPSAAEMQRGAEIAMVEYSLLPRAIAEALAAAREEGDRTGWDRRGERIAAWFETKAEMLSTPVGKEAPPPECAAIIEQHRSDAAFIRTTGYEPPKGEGEV